ncbi:hypothetical protein G7B40_039890 [Aetokthonos hydrillicola Thurmond2011]|jgi:hypothetical protein|uniref:Uncharacterized protein n=1 Tax=Aetokthonos hydrillicola Thurmond2011 TaxID=2712845 RepID=A0AAP5IF98_9CYAN|nr:hypothetical protein [Aetokthonos hydrillicola]MBW4590116.1 hypothetical protein [Aetokthonos hydrillicola CCALA 1050]MDR9900653.1 hypothetical protein [Aetokthonos hydrillicola Thurmond2011]
MKNDEKSIVRELLEALQDLLDFAELYGFKARTSYEDWSGYFEAARAAIAKAQALPER